MHLRVHDGGEECHGHEDDEEGEEIGHRLVDDAHDEPEGGDDVALVQEAHLPESVRF